jgi:aldehyde dehydrogenase (NAD+)
VLRHGVVHRIAGIDVAKRAAGVKRVHQEFGGKSPKVILDDADLVTAVTENVYRTMRNSSQTYHARHACRFPSAG